MRELLPLPKGNLNVRFRQMRGVWQVFCGNTYISGASGDSPDSAVDELSRQYAVPAGSVVKVNGLRGESSITV